MIPNDLNIWKLICRCVFLNKWKVLSRFFGKFNVFKYVSTCQKRSYDFWIMNAMCMFVYLFVEYFSFPSVISASIHRYVNYFDIQVLMMVTETKMLTSTLHHNIFTYLDYVFLLPSHIYMYIYIYIYICIFRQHFFVNANFIKHNRHFMPTYFLLDPNTRTSK